MGIPLFPYSRPCWWRLSHNQHMTGTATRFKSKSRSKPRYDRRPVGQSVLVSRPHLGPNSKLLLLSVSCGFVDVGRALWRDDGSVIYHCHGQWYMSSTFTDLHVGNLHSPQSQWPRSLRNELSSLARTLGSWVRIRLRA
jgi:hypothetical protein